MSEHTRKDVAGRKKKIETVKLEETDEFKELKREIQRLREDLSDSRKQNEANNLYIQEILRQHSNRITAMGGRVTESFEVLRNKEWK